MEHTREASGPESGHPTVARRVSPWWWLAGAVALGASVAAFETVQLRRRRPRRVDDLLNLCEDVSQTLLEQARHRSRLAG